MPKKIKQKETYTYDSFTYNVNVLNCMFTDSFNFITVTICQISTEDTETFTAECLSHREQKHRLGR